VKRLSEVMLMKVFEELIHGASGVSASRPVIS
jgi:hypothetical protein